MAFFDQDEDIICAVSTPPGDGGIAVVRLCGANSFEVIKRCCSFLPDHLETHKIYFGNILDQSGEPLDEVLVSYFQHGRSFTGQETFEVSCHGGSFVTSSVLKRILNCGARLAKKGEFTYRAFMNGKLDLSQAESVLSLIQSQTKKSSRLALRQLKGHFSKEIHKSIDSVTWVLANLEANIDFSAEDIVVAENSLLIQRLNQVLVQSQELLNSYKVGKLIKNGLKIAIVGSPNVGKSSLLNCFVGNDRAIVCETPGTTRDYLECEISIRGQKLIFLDTAGLRESVDKVEKIGIQKTHEILCSSDLVLYVFDCSKALGSDEIETINKIECENLLLVGNKADLSSVNKNKEFSFFKTSTINDKGIRELLNELTKRAEPELKDESVVLVQARHFECLNKAVKSLKSSLALIKQNESPDFIAFEVQNILAEFHEILGIRFDDQVLDRVFQEFCLGK